ncbi:response regulator transcription factor [Lacrimispora defluvii]|uniref:Stage 0 sporulation protein A homolog n=1 Tax=Lacrimispora defluvii TaxID=2719233 RepID=A0ABX1VYV0_9FIRM|nr:response regulator transcription factor [Lacrimispora defluvii]NNJ33037.1 response regulator transcription factor [Lacrimispora defluvii]
MEQKDILIIEDDKAIVRILELELKYEGYSFDIAYDGKEGLKQFYNMNYSLVLLDLMLPQISGMEVCKKIRENSNVTIIMVTAKRDLTDKVRGLDQGADDFITKPFEREELFARIRAGLRRGVIRSPEQKLIICGDLHVNLSTREVIRNGLSLELTKTEYDLLECLIINKGIVMTRSQLIEQVWGYDFGGDTNILDVYIRYLRNKIDYPFDRKLIRTIRGVGYSLKE